MNRKKLYNFIGFVCAILMVSMSHSSNTICDRFLVTFSGLGYNPVVDEVCPLANGEEANENLPYKKWCEEKFDNGSYIYQAYKDIAFNIEYTPEENKTDYWQSPDETARLKKGDCEDAVFLFYSHLPKDQNNAQIVWGWVVDKESAVGRAHVWYQLVDRKGYQWIVEGFSQHWNGIIPMEEIEKTETRKTIFTLPHLAVSSFVDSPKSANRRGNIPSFGFPDTYNHNSEKIPFTGDYATRSFPNSNREITNIINKLHELFSRYKIPPQTIASKRLQEKQLICKR